MLVPSSSVSEIIFGRLRRVRTASFSGALADGAVASWTAAGDGGGGTAAATALDGMDSTLPESGDFASGTSGTVGVRVGGRGGRALAPSTDSEDGGAGGTAFGDEPTAESPGPEAASSP